MRIVEAPSSTTDSTTDSTSNQSTSSSKPSDQLCIGIAQMAPIWLDRDATLAKVADSIRLAAKQGCKLVVFGEALVPGYPFWLELTGGAKFNDADQKQMHARYLREGVDIDRGDLKPISELAASLEISVYLGVMERAADRGGHSLYCSLVYIDNQGAIKSVHREATIITSSKTDAFR